MFQTNTNASLRNLETQVGQLALSLQNQSRNAFPSSTEINSKDLTSTSSNGNNELQGNKKMYNETDIGKKLRKNSLD